jgi:predicted lipid-binding transport protein (Tim44 family)
MKFWTFILAVVLTLGSVSAEAAKRLGSGRSIGKQSDNVTQREAAPKPPATAGAQVPNAAAAAPARKPWGAMLGGIAAGLGLAWLASSLGFGEELAQFMMFALLALAIMAAVGWFMRSRRSAGASSSKGPYAFQSANEAQPSGYKPENVGNDASARPWERASTAFMANKSSSAGFSGIGSSAGSASAAAPSALSGPQTWGVPAGFDTDGFLRAAKGNFVTLQSAWDRNDISTLRSMMTDEMLTEIRQQLTDRSSHTGGLANTTEVPVLNAQLLGVEELDGGYMASVEFSGMIREDQSAGPAPFREVWNMTKPKDGSSGWLVAGLQALH